MTGPRAGLRETPARRCGRLPASGQPEDGQMAGANDAPGAARFSISIDGVELGRFAELVTEAAPGAAPRALLAHELTHVVQQQAAAVRSSLGRLKWPPLVLKKGVVEQTALTRFKLANGTRKVGLSALDPAGRPGPAVTLLRAKVARAVEGPKSGGDVAIEEIVLAHEGFG